MNDNYPPGVTAYDIDAHAPSNYTGDPSDATCHESTFDEWREFVGEWFSGQDLVDYYNEGYTPREVNKLAAREELRLEAMADREQLEKDGGKE
jgi:hypothetical protein